METMRGYQERLKALLDEEWVRAHPADSEQIQDEISALESSIKGREAWVASAKIQLQRQLGVASLEGFRIEPLSSGLGEVDYFGRYYVNSSNAVILEKALANNTEIKVLHSVVENAREKKRLAEKGRWDTLVSVGGRYSFGEDTEKDYSVGINLRIKKFDTEVLTYSRLKAEADILNIETRIRELEFGLEARIRELKGEIENQRKQLQSLDESLQSRRKIYTLKLESYLKGEGSIDNLIQAFRSLMETETKFYEVENDYFDTIRDLDALCGVYFEKLGIEVR
jgi:outer membrane protein TolC